ncbi:MAG: hypothetical protein NTW79_04575 [Candidatus Berkelbacteria bacterium]|nr:hypothetical protein [Candidatus Berkelbacteria bacterium]
MTTDSVPTGNCQAKKVDRVYFVVNIFVIICLFLIVSAFVVVIVGTVDTRHKMEAGKPLSAFDRNVVSKYAWKDYPLAFGDVNSTGKSRN